MKKVNVSWLHTGKNNYDNGPSSTYYNDTVVFCWVKPIKPKTYEQISVIDSCRELFIERLRTFVSPEDEDDKRMNKKRIFNTNKMLFCAIIKNNKTNEKNAKNWVTEGKRVINVFEKYMGWSMSNVYKVDHAIPDTHIYMFSASVKWMRSPHLISLYLLLIRHAKDNMLKDFKSINDIEKKVKDFKNFIERWKKYDRPITERLKNDMVHFVKISPFIKKILDNVTKLFFHSPIKSNFSVECTEGITALVKGNITDKEIFDRFNKIMAGK
jgi:hypothetical protein